MEVPLPEFVRPARLSSGNLPAVIVGSSQRILNGNCLLALEGENRGSFDDCLDVSAKRYEIRVYVILYSFI